ncbi:MAG: hypothetical protein GY913_22580 [Proteobacteria bacterium]|nr:hypothetical protein [Pseudomonadota bacterium]
MWLTLILSSCASDGPWWEQRKPCPKGATLTGEAHSGEVGPIDLETLRPGKAIWCEVEPGFEGRHGPYTAWYPNGQMSDDAVYEDGVAVSLTAWSRLGHVELVVVEPGVFRRTLTYADGTRAVEGVLLRGGVPDGTWTEWDRSGAVIGQTTYVDGVAGELTGSSSLVMYVTRLDRGVSPQADLVLPVSTTAAEPPLAVTIHVTPSQILVDGAPLTRLDDRRIPPDELRGFLATNLYDRLIEKADQQRTIGVQVPELDFKGDLSLLIDQDTPWPTILPILYTAGQAQFRRFHFVVHTSAQWPPTTGPVQGERLMAAALMELPELGPDEMTWPPVVLLEADGVRVRLGQEETVVADMDAAIAMLPEGPGVVLTPAAESTYVEVIAAMDSLRPTHPEVVLAAGP